MSKVKIGLMVLVIVVLVVSFSFVGCKTTTVAETTAAETTAAATTAAATTAAATTAAETTAAATTAAATKTDYVIGFSNSYNGNTYRQTMEALFKKLADKMVADGTLASYKILESNNNVANQVSQIESLILDNVDAIMVDPGSGAGLNGAIEKATAAGIPVVIVNDGPVTTDKCYQINWDTTAMAAIGGNYVVERLNGTGKVIVIQGLAGVPFNEAFNTALKDLLAKSPGIEVVGDVYGEWTESVAQKQVASILPGIPQVDAVIGQGGDEYGALQAFIAANRPIPIIIGGNRGNFLSWWAAEKAKNGYATISWAANPWSAASGLYVAVDLLNGGYDVPKEMIMPALTITQDMIDDFANLAADEVANKEYDHQWIIDNYYTK